MKYDITHSCGCEETVELFGKGTDRERRIAAMESRPCAKCRAEEANAVPGLAALSGSDKQVAWACDIRAEMIAAMEAHRSVMAEKMSAEEFAAVEGDLAAAFAKMESIGSAEWFIDNRSMSRNGFKLIQKLHFEK